MRICFVNSEVFTFVGYSRLNRIVGRELVKRGIEVYVLVPQIKGHKRIEQLDGMTVLSFPSPLLKMLFSQNFFRLPEADIYEMWDPYFIFSYLVTRATPKSKHVVDFADPHDREDIKAIISADPKLKDARRRNNLKIPYFAYYPYLMYLRPYLAKKTISRADAYFCEANFLILKAKRMHSLKTEPIFVPHIAEIPIKKPLKSSQPTACFLARWDALKRVERFFELARHFPKVKFIAMGRANEPARGKKLWETGLEIPNLEMTGFVSEDRKREILDESWVVINTSVHEGLPQAFVEACSYRCAILSAVNPDDFAKNFGYHVQNDDFELGLEYLLEDDRWKERGERGFNYVRENYELNKVIERRIHVYQSLLGKR